MKDFQSEKTHDQGEAAHSNLSGHTRTFIVQTRLQPTSHHSEPTHNIEKTPYGSILKSINSTMANKLETGTNSNINNGNVIQMNGNDDEQPPSFEDLQQKRKTWEKEFKKRQRDSQLQKMKEEITSKPSLSSSSTSLTEEELNELKSQAWETVNRMSSKHHHVSRKNDRPKKRQKEYLQQNFSEVLNRLIEGHLKNKK